MGCIDTVTFAFTLDRKIIYETRYVVDNTLLEVVDPCPGFVNVYYPCNV